jgi:hypothetical protein
MTLKFLQTIKLMLNFDIFTNLYIILTVKIYGCHKFQKRHFS